MYTAGDKLRTRRSSVIVIQSVLLATLLLSGCASSKQELVSTQAELAQINNQLAAAESENSASQVEMAQLQQSLATAEARIDALQTENAGLDRELADTQAQLADSLAELDSVKYAAKRLLAQAETALTKEDLQEAQRVADLLAEEHPGTQEATRAVEIVGQIETILAEKAAKEGDRIAAATAEMNSETDAIRGVTFYKDKSTAESPLDNAFYSYIGQKGEQLWLRLYVQYHGSDWLFVRDMIIKSDDGTWNISPQYGEWKRDNSAYSVWEWYDGPVGPDELEMLNAIASADQAVVRFNGDTYYSDYVITAAEKQALRNVLDAFVALGGDLNMP